MVNVGIDVEINVDRIGLLKGTGPIRATPRFPFRAAACRAILGPGQNLLPRQGSSASLKIPTRRVSEGSEALPSLTRRVSV